MIEVVIDIPCSDLKNFRQWCYDNSILVTFLTFIQGNRISYVITITDDILLILKLKFFDMKLYHYIN